VSRLCTLDKQYTLIKQIPKQSKKEDQHELNIRDFKKIIGKLENVLEKKVMALHRISAAELTRRTFKPKHIRPVNDAAAQAAAPENKAMLAHIRGSRARIGYGFGMNVVLNKMSRNIRFEDPLRTGTPETWQLRSNARNNLSSVVEGYSSRLTSAQASFASFASAEASSASIRAMGGTL